MLVCSTSAGRPLRLRTGPATLEVERRIVDPRGRERVDRQTSSFETASELELPAEGTVEIALAELDNAFPQGALAERRRWRIRMRSGEIEDGGTSYPAMSVRVRAASEERLAPVLLESDVEPASPADLAQRAAEGDMLESEALGLAVLIPGDQREQALDLLALVVEDLPLSAVARLAPALRWLAPDADAGSDPTLWRGWLRVYREQGGTRATQAGTRRESASDDLDDRLDLPR